MKTKKILIVENQLVTAERVKGCLEKADYEAVTTPTGEEALELIKSHDYDVVLMDIHLDGKIDGITAARSMKKLSSAPVIFITELDDEVVFSSAQEVFPENYLVKPFNDISLLYAVRLALSNASQTSKYKASEDIESFIDGVFIPVTGQGSVKLLFDDILYIKANGAYTDIYYDSKDDKKGSFYKVSKSSNHVVAQLDYPAIVKVNRSWYVNIKKIEKIHNSSVFIQGKEITLSDDHSSTIKKMLHFFKH